MRIGHIVLPDGGELEYDEMSVVPVGDRGIPDWVVYKHSGGDGEPAFDVRIEVWDGVPVCTEVRVTAKPDDRIHVRAKDLRLVAAELENSIEYWLTELHYQPTYTRNGRRGWERARPVAAKERAAARTSIRGARRGARRKMTIEYLQKVADTYLAGGATPTQAVAAAFGIPPRTASRHVEKARDARLLPPATRQGQKP